MEKKFKETSIPEDFSKALAKQSVLIGPDNAFRIANVLFKGVSTYLSAVKNYQVPKGIIIRSVGGDFLVGAKVEYFANEADPTNYSAGRWDYTWTCYESDMEGVDATNFESNNSILVYFTQAAQQLYNFKYASIDICVSSLIIIIEMILNWIRDNTSQTSPATLTLENCFKAVGKVEDGKVVIAIIPDGAMKVLIKDDSAIQEA